MTLRGIEGTVDDEDDAACRLDLAGCDLAGTDLSGLDRLGLGSLDFDAATVVLVLLFFAALLVLSFFADDTLDRAETVGEDSTGSTEDEDDDATFAGDC